MISYFLLFVLGSLILKSLDIRTDSINTCQEFAHIHIYKLKKLVHTSVARQEHEVISSHSDQDMDCHEAKSILSYSNLPAQVFNFVPTNYRFVFEAILNIPNHFKNQDLEPHRRPPRLEIV